MPGALGLSISSRSGLSPRQFAAYARAAEERGFDAVFATENYSDALALAQAMAATTQRIRVGTAIANVYLRHPVLMALTAAAINELSEGRFILGLGTASAAFNEGILGLPPEPPLQRMRECVAVIRAVLSGQPVSFNGQLIHVNRFQPYRHPTHPDVPVYVGALLPRMLRLAAEIADGLLLNLTTPQQVSSTIERVRASARLAGRDPATLRIACIVPCCISSDWSAARRAAREMLVGYAWHPAATRLLTASGFAEEMTAVAEALRAGDRAGAIAQVSDAMAAALVVHGPPDVCREQLAAYRRAGVELPIIFPVPVEGDWDVAISAAIQVFTEET